MKFHLYLRKSCISGLWSPLRPILANTVLALDKSKQLGSYSLTTLPPVQFFCVTFIAKRYSRDKADPLEYEPVYFLTVCRYVFVLLIEEYYYTHTEQNPDLSQIISNASDT